MLQAWKVIYNKTKNIFLFTDTQWLENIQLKVSILERCMSEILTKHV